MKLGFWKGQGKPFSIGFGTLGGGAWLNVSVPDAAFSFVPFTIQQNGRVFRPAPSFNLRTYANITVPQTYYVDVTSGNDSNTGLSWAQAWKSIWKAAGTADATQILIKAGYYFRNQGFAGNTPAASCEIIAVDGPVYATTDTYNTLGPFSPVASHYEGSGAGRTIQDVYDAAAPDSYGDDVRLTKKTSIAEVDAAENSWWQDGGTLVVYLHLASNRAPDANVRCYESSALFTRDNKSFYMENIHWRGGVGFRNSSATGGLKVYLKDCSAKYALSTDAFDVDGTTETIFQNCLAAKSVAGDGFSYHVRNGVVPKAIEIDCEGYDCGDATTDQGSTMHDAGTIVRINGEYHHTRGQCVADVGASMAWLLGTSLHDAESTGANDDGYFCGNSGAKSWLDSCTISVANFDLISEAGTTIYTRNLVSDGNNSIAGTLAAY